MAAQRIGSYVEVSPGVDIYYEDEGEGAPLVLIPGWTFTTRVFDHQFAAFAGDYRVISFDPRSHGRSTVTSDGNNYATQAADLATLLDHLGVENPVLLGWSAGSLTAWHHVRNRGTGGLRSFVSVDMPPLGMSCDGSDWVEGGDPRSRRVLPGGADRPGPARHRHLVRRQRHDRRGDDAGGDGVGGRAVAGDAADHRRQPDRRRVLRQLSGGGEAGGRGYSVALLRRRPLGRDRESPSWPRTARARGSRPSAAI